MIELYGHPISDYATKIKIALLEKNIEFSEIKQSPSQDDEYVKLSYTGRIPIIKTETGVIAESQAIIEYLEEKYPEPPLLPNDPMERARCRQTAAIIENYVDIPARKVYSKFVAGLEFTEDDIKSANTEIKKAATALDLLGAFKSYAATEQFSMADCSAMAIMPLVDDYFTELTEINISDLFAGYSEYYERMLNEKGYLGKIEKQRKSAMKAIFRIRKNS